MPSEKKKPADKEPDKKSTDKASILSPDELKEYADTFTGLAEDFRTAPEKYSDIGHLDTERERIENQAGRNMMALIKGDSKGPWRALPDFPDRLQTYDEDKASAFWPLFAAWIRAQRPLKFKGKAGQFDLPRPRRDKKGRLIPKSGVVLVAVDSSGKEIVYDDDEAGGIQTVYRGDEAALKRSGIKRLGVKTKGGRGHVLAKDHLVCARLQAEDNADHCEVMAEIILDEIKHRSKEKGLRKRRSIHQCPHCESRTTRIYSTKKLKRYHKCFRCNRTFITPRSRK